MLFDYDDTNINSVLNYAKKIENMHLEIFLICVKNISLMQKMVMK